MTPANFSHSLMIQRIFLFFLLFGMFPAHYVNSQNLTFPLSNQKNEIIETCSGVFTDSSGDTLTHYGVNEDYSLTFRANESDDQTFYLKVDFSFFELGEGDYLYIYDGDSPDAPLIIQATGTELKGEQIWSTGEFLHFRFTSSPSFTGAGWWAYVSCFELCDAFVADFQTNTGTYDFCPEVGDVTFTASSFFLGGEYQDPSPTYEWSFSGQLYTGSSVTHSFLQPGAYTVRLTARDMANNCEADTLKTIRLATVPVFDNTIASSDTICAEEVFSLAGNVIPQRWTDFPTEVDTVAFVDNENDFSAVLEFDVFEDGAVLQSIDDFDRVCVRIEHLDYGDLMFELQCPNGTSVLLKDAMGGGAYMGEPVVFSEEIPGVGYEYCFASDAPFGQMEQTTPVYYEYTDASETYVIGSLMPAGVFTPAQSLNDLVGCPLNGEWQLSVSDEFAGNSGYVFGWGIYFDEKFYPDSLIFTPRIVEEQWFDSRNNPLEGNPASISEDEKGSYTYRFRATDDFGCQWDTTVTVQVLPLPRAEIVSELEIPVCEGDSTVFATNALNVGDDFHWIYQWMLEGAEWEGRTYDTLMAKEPANYMVRVTDTITGCADFFEKTLSTKNCDLEIPNVFTPNNDGINDLFEIINLSEYPNSTIVIYNRYGKKVFEHNDYADNWWDGGNHPDGTYYYVLTYTRQGERRQTQGVITIVR